MASRRSSTHPTAQIWHPVIITSSPHYRKNFEKLDDDDDVKTAVMEHFADKEPEYFLKGIELLVHICEKCVEIKGDNIEK